MRRPVAGRNKTKAERRPPRVLVVGPDEAEGASCCDALRLWGFDPRWTSDAESALRLAAERAPVALVIDLDLPRHDPLDVVQALRAHGPTRDVAVVALAGSLEDDLVELALQRGCDTMLAKPADVDEIAAEAERLLCRRRRAA